MARAANKTEQAAGREPDTSAAANVAAIIKLDPRLFMAARRGDCKRLKDLLKLNDGDSNEQATATAEAAAQVVVEVDRRRRPAAAAPASGLLDLVTIEGDSLLHVVAACGDGEEFLDGAKVLFSHDKDLLAARNNKGDTPLHCAAIAGNEKMVTFLVLLATVREMEMKELLRIRNKCGETALHYAVRAHRKDIVDKLMSEDPDLACNDAPDEASPLYLAISLGEMGIAQRLFDTIKTKGKPSNYSGPDSRNVLHAAAVSRGPALRKLVEWLKDVKAVEDEVQQEGLLSRLARQRDKNGSTPLHLATSLDGLPYSEFISGLAVPWRWSTTSRATTLLLDADTCPVYQPDNKGLYPIHVAAWAGRLDVVELLLRRCPDCATLRDGEGRTYLHVAVESKSWNIVRHAWISSSELRSVLNLQDNNGDTALHRAVQVGHLPAFKYLVWNEHVRLDVANKEGLTPRDLWWTTTPNTFHHLWNQRNTIINSLILVGAPHGEIRCDLLYEKHVAKRDYKYESEKLTNTAQVMSFIPVLIATVTFASAFTLPGGYQQSGAPVLAGNYAFGAFILADALAFICSCQATALLAFAGAPTVDLANRYHTSSGSYQLLQISVRSLLMAFALGLYVVLAPVARGTAILICVIILLFSVQTDLQSFYVIDMTTMAMGRSRVQMWDTIFMLLSQVWPYIVIFGLPPILNLKVVTHH